MYSRNVTKAPDAIVQNGKPVFGTFNSLPKKLDIKGLSAPFYGIAFPPIITRLRIRARACYFFSVENYFGVVEFFDNKIMNTAEFALWNVKTGVKYIYRILLGIRRNLVPVKLERAQCVSYSKSRHMRISWHHPADRLSLTVNVRAGNHRPEINVFFAGRFSDKASAEALCVSPSPTTARCSATWYATTPFKGRIAINGAENASLNTRGNALLLVNRSYHKFFTYGESITSAGTVADKYISFRFITTNLDAHDAEKYNNNVLFYGGKFSPMPPVCITHPFGISKNWIIQDFESMVDLEFTPQNSYSRKTDFILVKSETETVFGVLNGTLLDKDGNKIVLKDFPAAAKKTEVRL